MTILNILKQTRDEVMNDETKMSTRTVPMPDIPILESEEMWSQRAIDTPEAVLEELKLLKEQMPKPA
jgi:hypothetical protein